MVCEISLRRRHAPTVTDGAYCHKMDYVTIFLGDSKSRRASKSHYWFKSYGDFAEWVDSSHWWSFIGKGLLLQPAQQACFHHTITYHTMCHVSRITCQMSHFTCHLTCITSQVSNVTHFFFFFLLESGRVSLWRVCYQWGLPRLVFRLFLIQNTLIPKIYLFQLVWSIFYH